MKCENTLFSGSDSDDALPEKFHKPDLARKNARRTGKLAQAKRKEKFQNFKNEQTYRRRLEGLSDPIYNFSRTQDHDDLEAKFAQWDKILKDGGTIFDASEMGGPVLIETEQLDDLQMEKHSIFVASKCPGEEILEYTSASVVSDEIVEPNVKLELPDEPLATMDVDESEVFEEVQPKLRLFDLGNVKADHSLIDIGNLPQEPQIFDLGTGIPLNQLTRPKDLVAVPSSSNAIRNKPQQRLLKVRWGGRDYVLDSDTDLTPVIKSPGFMDPPDDIASADDHAVGFEPLTVEIFRKDSIGIQAWTSHRVSRIVLAASVLNVTQFHPLTRKEAFEEWDIRMCIYRPDSPGDYVRELVPYSHRIR